MEFEGEVIMLAEGGGMVLKIIFTKLPTTEKSN